MSAAAPLVGPAVPRGPGAARRGRVHGALALLRATGPVGIASAVVIAIAIAMAIFGTFIAPYDPNLPNLSLAWGAPSGGHLLGYDFQGRDVLSRVLVGARTAMLGPASTSCSRSPASC
jgi:peptide/nickel transport system permease protein